MWLIFIKEVKTKINIAFEEILISFIIWEEIKKELEKLL
jgi:hypothetical protein